MPPIESARQFHHPASDVNNVKGAREQGTSFEAPKQPGTIAIRDKDLAGPGGFENIVNGRYSAIGRGGSVGDELVRKHACSCLAGFRRK
jgi:hypothetical protein